MPNGEDIKDRYAGRLGGDDDQDEQNENDGSAGSDQSDKNVWNVGNVKEEWKGWTVYLPEEYLDDVKDESKLLDVRLDRDVKMDRHFKPALIALGMERMEGMEDEEISAFLERMERGELDND